MIAGVTLATIVAADDETVTFAPQFAVTGFELTDWIVAISDTAGVDGPVCFTVVVSIHTCYLIITNIK
jgi:hypothetical protein